jgi:hypothetical protein
VPRKTITANVSLPPEIHAWVKGKIAAILEVEPAANPIFTGVVSDALRRAMRDEEKATLIAESPEAAPLPPIATTKAKYKNARESKKQMGSKIRNKLGLEFQNVGRMSAPEGVR